ncbi:DUF6089 family protein [Flavobacterium sp. RHBU_3]|uniref:type IX secretion system protein PorG n=1 Tax=Flavobacterium sp. RHBU_3 TaxID=3391184 RepID=UPI0039847D1C
MKRLLYIILVATTTFSAEAQINELGIYAGGANYIGDVGPTDYIAPNDLALGVIYKWNRSPRHSWRASFTYGKIGSDDADSNVDGRKARGYSFKNSVKELSLGLEFNFFDFNLHEEHFKWTPYIYTGLSYTWYGELYKDGNEGKEYSNGSTLAIPMVVGVKAHIARDFTLGVETGPRYSFTDNLDGSNPDNSKYPGLRFGNLNSNDWYVFTGVTLTYTFGEKPCYCAD